MSVTQAVEAGCKTLVIGVANRGGIISAEWKSMSNRSIRGWFGYCFWLAQPTTHDEADLVAKANELGRTLHDVRVPSVEFPIATGVKRSGKRCLAVGTDCSVGKMYTGLALEKEMHARKMKATFRSTGQTGILITGNGIPLDAVIADFMAGSVEWQ